MGAGNILPDKGIKVTIGGKEQSLRFTVRTLAILAEKYGSVTAALEIFTTMSGGQMGVKELLGLADLVSAALTHSGNEISPEEVADSMDVEEITEIMPQLVEAFLAAMGAKKGGSKNPPKPKRTGRGSISTQ